MQLSNAVKNSVATALCILVGSGYIIGHQADAFAIKNPFKKATPPPDKPPPGMTDMEDAANSPTDKTLGRDEDNPGHKSEAKSDSKSDTASSKDSEGSVSSAAVESDDPTDDNIGDPEVHLHEAKRLVSRKRYKEALVEVNEALKLNKHLWAARYLGAYIYQLEGRVPEAITRYKQYLAVKPDNQQAHINLGVLYRSEGRLDEAEDEYRKAIDLNFYSLQAHYNLANMLIAQDKLEEALKELRACEKIAPTNALVHNNLGVIFLRRDYLEEAEQEFRKAANLEPANTSFVQNMTMVHEQLSRKKQAKTIKAKTL